MLRGEDTYAIIIIIVFPPRILIGKKGAASIHIYYYGTTNNINTSPGLILIGRGKHFFPLAHVISIKSLLLLLLLLCGGRNNATSTTDTYLHKKYINSDE